MIVLLTENKDIDYIVISGDTFNLCISDSSGETHTIIKEEITYTTNITYAASFIFCLENGVVTSPNVCGIFGNSGDIPEEIKTAKRLNDLTKEQLEELIRTSPLKMLKHN